MGLSGSNLHGRINVLIYLDTDMSNYSTGAFLRYMKGSVKH